MRGVPSRVADATPHRIVRPVAGRRELIAVLSLSALLIVARSAVFLAYETFFDSDQAIVGLMAKHLAEGRAFPLFFYGQSYMLAVEAWAAAPVVFVFGPTVAALRSVLVLFNLAAAALMIIALVKGAGLRPWHALIASLFFVFAPPFTSARLLEAMGGNIEPFVYLPLLWMLRDRPLWFGAVLAVGFLNREFSALAVPVLMLGQVLTGDLFRPATLHRWLLAFVAFLAVLGGVRAVQPFADAAGPGTRGVVAPVAGGAIENLTVRTRFVLTEVPERIAGFATHLLPVVMGGRRVEESFASQGRDWMAFPLAVAAAMALVRIGVLVASARRGSSSALPTALRAASFAWYLLATGLLAALVAIVTRPLDNLPVRYLLLAVYIPVGLVGVWLSLEPRAFARRGLIAAVLSWGLFSGIDHAIEIRRYAQATQPDAIRVLADALVARGVRVAEAPYWRAYKLTYLTGERVKFASSDVVRIDEYQRLAQQEPGLLRLQDSPCPDGERIASWYLCRTPQ